MLVNLSLGFYLRYLRYLRECKTTIHSSFCILYPFDPFCILFYPFVASRSLGGQVGEHHPGGYET